jgi:O-antigen ligase
MHQKRRRAIELSGELRSQSSRQGRGAAAAIFLLLAWGTFAFGAVYPWAYVPLMAGATLTGVACLIQFGARGRIAVVPAIAFGLVVGAILLQTVPLPPELRTALSPAHTPLLSQLELGVLVDPGAWRPLTIAPTRTFVAAACAASLFLLVIGAACWLSVYGARRFVSGLATVGLILAVAGVAQRPLFGTAIYGFWEPLMLRRPYEPFGPFVLENHFGGWMLLVLPLVMSLACARVARGTRSQATWHARFAWLGSAEAQQSWLLALATGAMSVSLLLTFSRSAIGAFVLVLALVGGLALRGTTSRRQRLVALMLVLSTGIGAIAWTGLDRIVTFYREAPWDSLNVRLGPWRDAVSVVQDFWLTGTGMNTYAQAMIVYQRFGVEWAHYSQAHNDYLQVLAEGGLLVAVPAALAIIALAFEVGRRFRETLRGSTSWWLRSGSVVSLLAIGVQETVEFSLQIPGNAVLCALVVAVAIHRSPPPRET